MSEKADSAQEKENLSAKEGDTQTEAQQKSKTNSQDSSNTEGGGSNSEEIRKLIQSEVDKKLAAAAKQSSKALDESNARLAQILGVEPADMAKAQDTMTTEEMLKAFRGGDLSFAENSDSSGKLAGKSALDEASSILGDLNISPTSAVGEEMLATVKETVYNNRDSLKTALTMEMANRLTKPNASDATKSSQDGGSSAKEDADQVVLRKAYDKELGEARLSAGRAISAQALTRIKAKHRDKGLDIF